jgi:hypothetical protein
VRAEESAATTSWEACSIIGAYTNQPRSYPRFRLKSAPHLCHLPRRGGRQRKMFVGVQYQNGVHASIMYDLLRFEDDVETKCRSHACVPLRIEALGPNERRRGEHEPATPPPRCFISQCSASCRAGSFFLRSFHHSACHILPTDAPSNYFLAGTRTTFRLGHDTVRSRISCDHPH